MKDNVDRLLAQWRKQRPDVDTTPMGVVGRLSRASRVLERELRRFFSARGLQPYEFDILATLRRSGEPCELTAGALVESSMVTSGAITNRIDRLVVKELVTRRTDPENRRSVLIGLTETGRQLVDEMVSDHVENERRLLRALSDEEQRALSGLLRKLLIGLEDVPRQDE